MLAGMLGLSADARSSNWVRVITVLQSAGVEPPVVTAGLFGQSPLIVITGASGGTSAAFAVSAGLPSSAFFVVSPWFWLVAGAEGCSVSGAAGCWASIAPARLNVVKSVKGRRVRRFIGKS